MSRFTQGIVRLFGVTREESRVVTLSALMFFFQVLRRGVQYGLTKPARSTLFTVVKRDERYKAKCFIDTYVYRTGDAAGAGLSRGLAASVGGVPYVAAGLAVVWMVTGIGLGISQRKRAGARPEPSWATPPGVTPAMVPLVRTDGSTPPVA